MSPLSPLTRPARWLSVLGSGAQVCVLAIVAYALLFHLSIVRGSSMIPGIHDGDRILVDHLSYVLGDVQRGDVVVLRCPLDPSLDYIKRVIALPGDEVRIDDGSVFVNGEQVDEPYVAEPGIGSYEDAGPDGARRSRLRETIERDHYFVLGDNRDHSSDSREFGQVPRANLRGRVDFRVWPPDRAGTVR